MSPSNLKRSLYLTRDNSCVNLFQGLHNCSPPQKTNKQTEQTNKTKQKTETTGHDDYQPIKIQCDPTLHCSAPSPGESTPGSCPWSSAQFLITIILLHCITSCPCWVCLTPQSTWSWENTDHHRFLLRWRSFLSTSDVSTRINVWVGI